ncbi:hypothetical protein GCM10020367_25600 [Streptomyces sannanensis]|uniref:non-specific serine/threonine protein kinase n=1 Tax=Streptomyces sannanensis TaxID=285536 RepID=A0ABP6SAY6_9ACTN
MRPVGSKYLLEEPLGRGATGTVWRARHAAEPGEIVAIKVLKEELANDADVVMRFLRERSVLLRLTHPNIVRTRDLVVEGDLLALVMDLVDGPDLHHYIRDNGPFTPVAAALLTAQIADALAASHADGVVHRDLKPANVLLRSDGDQMHPMLTDFGIARLADSPGLTRTHEFVGTPAYVAPESAEGRPQTSAVDVYGAGIMLYELVTGRPPFAGGTALEVLHRHLSEEPRRPTTVPEPLWTVIERCLRKEPGERPSAENLARALRVVAAGTGVHATAAQVEAADGVGALLDPDPAPATVPAPDLPQVPGAADPTQVLPTNSANAAAYDPNGATSVLPQTGAADPTSVMPPVSAQQPDQPHPWQTQLRAARERNEQTQIQYLDPSEDPLLRRPQRQAPQQPPRPPQAYQQPQQPQRPQQRRPQPQPQRYPQQQPQQQRYAPPPPQQYAPQPYQQPQASQPYQQPQAPQAPRQPAPRPAREPREPRRRSANPMHIPGLGCLKGCLFTVVLLFVAGWLIWELTPLQDWVAQGKSYWQAIGDAISAVTDWISELGGSSGSTGK